MCPTSPKAEYFKMGCNMAKYVVNHSLFFRKEFMTITFDECLNKIVQQSEMNVFVCFWGINRHKVSSLFCDSKFVGHTAHLNVVFIGRFGQEIWFYLNDSSVYQWTKHIPQCPRGVSEKECWRGITTIYWHKNIYFHRFYGVFETGATKIGWNLKKLLKGAHKILCDTPAWRGDYFNLTGCSKSPLPFVATRWI